MHPIHVDRLARFLAANGSRRVLLGTALTGVLTPLGHDVTAAKNKKKRDASAAKNRKKACPPCKKRKQGKCKANVADGTACAGGACQSGSCILSAPQPGPDAPITSADAACVSQHTSFSTYPRNAQTFRALRSGQLTSASIELYSNVEGADFDMEIWSVDGANAPSTVLAGTTIANVPATPPGPRTLTGTFAAPATVVQGLLYALVITGRAGQSSGIYGLPTDACPDGIWFYATTPNGAFTAYPGSDLGFATFVTA
jgi:hypothetical protein